MRHVRLFENFGTNPIITASGDFSKLKKDTSLTDSTMRNFIKWTQPDTYRVTYHTNPNETMRRVEANVYGQGAMKLNLEEGVEEIVGADQNGTNLYKGLQLTDFRAPMVMFSPDPSIPPEDFKRRLEDFINNFNKNLEIEKDQCIEILKDPLKNRKYTPEFLSHCEALVHDGAGTYINPRISLIFKVI